MALSPLITPNGAIENLKQILASNEARSVKLEKISNFLSKIEIFFFYSFPADIRRDNLLKKLKFFFWKEKHNQELEQEISIVSFLLKRIKKFS